MPYVTKPRPYAHEYDLQLKRGEHADRLERQRAREILDHKGVNRKGKDISHNKALSKGGTNADGYKLESIAANRGRNYKVKGPK